MKVKSNEKEYSRDKMICKAGHGKLNKNLTLKFPLSSGYFSSPFLLLTAHSSLLSIPLLPLHHQIELDQFLLDLFLELFLLLLIRQRGQ